MDNSIADIAHLVKHGLCVHPKCSDAEFFQRVGGEGGSDAYF